MADDDALPKTPQKPAPATQRTDRRLLEFLVCPVTRGQLTYDVARQELVSPRARLAFPIRNGVPLMSVDSARPLDDPP
ncbi:MAG: Trm112 family protein [Hyphomicrobiaceae bacterium]